jgi:hypothetical protein
MFDIFCRHCQVILFFIGRLPLETLVILHA